MRARVGCCVSWWCDPNNRAKSEIVDGNVHSWQVCIQSSRLAAGVDAVFLNAATFYFYFDKTVSDTICNSKFVFLNQMQTLERLSIQQWDMV